jgi:hypothetical protein
MGLCAFEPFLEEIMENETMPSLISLEEFILAMGKQKTYPIETLNSYCYWIAKQGHPKRWPYIMWLKRFEEFNKREVK